MRVAEGNISPAEGAAQRSATRGAKPPARARARPRQQRNVHSLQNLTKASASPPLAHHQRDAPKRSGGKPRRPKVERTSEAKWPQGTARETERVSPDRVAVARRGGYAGCSFSPSLLGRKPPRSVLGICTARRAPTKSAARVLPRRPRRPRPHREAVAETHRPTPTPPRRGRRTIQPTLGGFARIAPRRGIAEFERRSETRTPAPNAAPEGVTTK